MARYNRGMAEVAETEVLTRFRTALELYELGVGMMLENLKRAYPSASEQEIERHLCGWLTERPGAELGDGVGLRVLARQPRVPGSISRSVASRSSIVKDGGDAGGTTLT